MVLMISFSFSFSFSFLLLLVFAVSLEGVSLEGVTVEEVTLEEIPTLRTTEWEPYIARQYFDSSTLGSWKGRDELSRKLPATLKCHSSLRKSVQMMSRVQPFGRLENVTWLRPYTEKSVDTDEFLRGALGEERLYFMSNLESLQPELLKDVEPLLIRVAAGEPIAEANLWIGFDNVRSPLHYDALSNHYLQIQGRKRFLILGPEHHGSCQLYPRLHPSTRQAQIDPMAGDDPADLRGHWKEVTLNPGDMLYIPPHYFHQAATVGPDASVSISVHQTTAAYTLNRAFMNYPVPVRKAWTMQQRLIALREYLRQLFDAFGTDATTGICGKLLGTRYMPLLLAASNVSSGLSFAINQSINNAFAEGQDFPQELGVFMEKHARELSSQVNSGVGCVEPQIEIELLNVVEDIVNYVVGTRKVYSFFKVFCVHQ
eukprot:g2925.t1